MKKYLKILTIVLLVGLLVGCGCQKKDKIDNNTNNKRDYEKETKEVEALFNTDDSKLVYNSNNLFNIVFYYKGNDITGLEHYYKFSSGEEADKKAEELKKEFENNTSFAVSSKGIYVIYTYNESEYKDKTVSEIKDSYSFLIPVYNK